MDLSAGQRLPRRAARSARAGAAAAGGPCTPYPQPVGRRGRCLHALPALGSARLACGPVWRGAPALPPVHGAHQDGTGNSCHGHIIPGRQQPPLYFLRAHGGKRGCGSQPARRRGPPGRLCTAVEEPASAEGARSHHWCSPQGHRLGARSPKPRVHGLGASASPCSSPAASASGTAAGRRGSGCRSPASASLKQPRAAVERNPGRSSPCGEAERRQGLQRHLQPAGHLAGPQRPAAATALQRG
mmetsp:Transcript_21182/g.58804  ORF Transcript_21182/g.58804 Transcript_21182/m.58804 type:complete len:243 (+) Transcript_21182:760-1488(+)